MRKWKVEHYNYDTETFFIEKFTELAGKFNYAVLVVNQETDRFVLVGGGTLPDDASLNESLIQAAAIADSLNNLEKK